MAKRTESSTPRRSGRTRTSKTTPADATQPVATANDSGTVRDELPNIPEPGDVADQAQRSESIAAAQAQRAESMAAAQAQRSESMAAEPSEEDIRLRAYHRFLERGAVHGRHFDDWLEAERELKERSPKS